jgi:dipeptidyl aminopeptidase/acylaminoacyl peptidase
MHFQAGWRTWELAMQDDITDGIDYLVSQGLVDRQRVCIMGASYGGYATLMGMVKEPDLFRCGVDVSGPSDIELEFTAWSDFSDSIWQRYSMRQLVGDPDTMRDQLRQTSPFRQAGRIKAPVLLVHGEKDWRVPITHAKRMRDALQEHHAAYEWLELPGEGHGFLKWDNLTRFYDAVANFLRKYNPPD